jgi:hypothetical protein
LQTLKKREFTKIEFGKQKDTDCSFSRPLITLFESGSYLRNLQQKNYSSNSQAAFVL